MPWRATAPSVANAASSNGTLSPCFGRSGNACYQQSRNTGDFGVHRKPSTRAGNSIAGQKLVIPSPTAMTVPALLYPGLCGWSSRLRTA